MCYWPRLFDTFHLRTWHLQILFLKQNCFEPPFGPGTQIRVFGMRLMDEVGQISSVRVLRCGSHRRGAHSRGRSPYETIDDSQNNGSKGNA
uniref:Uncharacterized protein n=1 Tax=Pyxicephalus adspersus TaxID=30357 RepID=A0AAV3A2B9_PYXAD|nr:TPA: hypothetical protein GDO54_017528 [Pyxicephalus adspersus]